MGICTGLCFETRKKAACRQGVEYSLFSSTKENGSHRPPPPAEILTFQRYREFVESFLQGFQVKGRIGFSLLKAGEAAYTAFITDHCGDPVGAAVHGPGVIADALSTVSQQGAPDAGN